MQIHPANLPLDLVDLEFAVPSHGQQIPSGIDSAYVVASQAAGSDDWVASTIVAT
jgi:hypothetical protein